MNNIEPINSPSGETRFKIKEGGLNLILPPKENQTMHLYNSEGEEVYILDYEHLLKNYTFNGKPIRLLMSYYGFNMVI